jgi:hypothetical protein
MGNGVVKTKSGDYLMKLPIFVLINNFYQVKSFKENYLLGEQLGSGAFSVVRKATNSVIS